MSGLALESTLSPKGNLRVRCRRIPSTAFTSAYSAGWEQHIHGALEMMTALPVGTANCQIARGAHNILM